MAAIITDADVVTQPTDDLLHRARLAQFRAGWYGCLTRWSDTLFEVTDALLSAPGPMASLPYLSLEASCRRGWGSVYAALADGRIDTIVAADLLADHLPDSWWPVFAVDVTPWPRPEARCSPRRGVCRVAEAGGRHDGRFLPGWAYQWVCQVSPDPDSWTAPVHVRRVDPDHFAVDVACTQILATCARLARTRPGVVPVFCLDAGYCPVTVTMAVAQHPHIPARVIVRLRRSRVFYFDPLPRPAGQTGRHKRHGDRFAFRDPSTWPAPHTELSLVDDAHGQVRVQAWYGLHPKPQNGTRRRWGRQQHNPRSGVAAPIVRGTVIRLTLQHPQPGQPQTMWLWTAGPDRLDLNLCWRAYLRRFGIEHTNRFIKQHLSWTRPAIRTPQQADRWSWLVAAAYTQLRLAKPLITDRRLPWERRLTPATLTPLRVQRGFRGLLPDLPTPAKPRKPCKPGPGRPPGQPNRQPTPRHKVVKKGVSKPEP